jgi:hypothetical protein
MESGIESVDPVAHVDHCVSATGDLSSRPYPGSALPGQLPRLMATDVPAPIQAVAEFGDLGEMGARNLAPTRPGAVERARQLWRDMLGEDHPKTWARLTISLSG